MFTEAKLRRDIEGNYGILENYSVYEYGGARRIRALIGVVLEVDENRESYIPSDPCVIYQHTLTPISQRADLGGTNLDRAEKYVKAKKPILSAINQDTILVGIEVNSREEQGKVMVYDFHNIEDTLVLRPSAFKMPMVVEERMIGMLRQSNGDRAKFLELRMNNQEELSKDYFEEF